MKLFDLTGKVAIVTGGNGGIGLGIARGLAQAGAAIVVAGRQATKSAGAVKELEALGTRAAAVEVDVRREASCRELVQETVDRFGRLDILVNNAGTNIRKRPEEYTLEEWHTVLDTNLPIQVGESKLAPRDYYLALERTGKDAYSLVFLDPREIRAQRLDAFLVHQTKGGIVVPLTHSKGDEVAAKLAITLELEEGSKTKGTFTIRFGPHRLSAPLLIAMEQ